MISMNYFFPLPILLLTIVTLVSPLTHAAAQLAKAKACMACHQIERKVVGPAFQDIAARYAARSDAQTAMVQKILIGSSGEWGVIPMPANRNVKKEEAEKLAQWIAGLKKP